MPTVKFDISEAEEIAKHLRVDIEKVAKRAILATAHRMVQHIITVVIPREPRQPVDRGAYRAAWKAIKDPRGAIVYNGIPYGGIVEDGARAENVKISRAMIIALTGWVMRKGIGKRGPRPKGQTRAQAKVARYQEAQRIAWAIAMGMKKHGIFNRGHGLKILEKALKIVANAFAQELKTEIGREYRR